MLETEHLEHCKIIFILTLLFLTQSFPQNYPDKNIDRLLDQGINKIIMEHYNEAEQIFGKLDSCYNELPLGKIYLAAVKIAEAYDYDEPFDKKFIEDNLDEADSRADKLVEKDENNVWNIYLKALSIGYYAYYEVLNHNWLSAISKGFDSMHEFENCISIDSNFYDAYAVLGTFKYWSSKKAESLKFLPFVSDDRKLGIEYLKKAINNSGYNSYLAINSLVWIYINEKNFNDARQLAERALNKYPGSRFFMWGLARTLEENDPGKAIEIYQDIYNSYEAINKLSFFHEILLKHLMAQQYAALGKN